MNNIEKKGEKLTFLQLFKKYDYQIEIPIIQRDYAQGRKRNEEIRETFLENLKIKLKSKENIDLDFVYGSIDEKKFIPLDGQQRLTTLFLLHCYLAHTSKKIDVFKNVIQRDGKSKFTYETRISSREFCNALLENDFDSSEWEKSKVSDIIKDASWFFYSWEQDPTIKGMLTMLDAIQEKFGKEQFYEILEQEENPVITFQFLNLKKYNLTDDLYIKMNARGKLLTEFENFKAKFEDFIEKKHPKKSSDFAKNIDGIWCDLFWDYSVNKEDEENPKVETLVDKPFLNFIKFIAEMLYYKDETNNFNFKKFTEIEKIFADEANLNFLFEAFDLFVNGNETGFKSSIEEFFKKLFSYRYENDKVPLFDEKVNLFEKCIYDTIDQQDKLSAQNKLLLYAIIYYKTQNKEKLNITENFKDYIRVSRNFILRINQIDKDTISPDLRTGIYKDIIKTIHLIYDSNEVYKKLPGKKFDFRKDNIQHEIDKAKYICENSILKKQIHKIEDHHYFRGTVFNVDFIYKEESLSENAEKWIDLIFAIWEIDDSLITRSLLSIGDYSIPIAFSKIMGVLHFFGKRDKWNRILAIGDEKLKPILKKYLTTIADDSIPKNKLELENKLEKLIDDDIKKLNSNNWIYYFLKYPQITTNDHNIYVLREQEKDNEGFRMEYINGITIRNRHIDILNKAVIESETIDSNKIIEEGKGSWVKYRYEEPIYCENKIELHPKKKFWEIKIPNTFEIPEILITKYNLTEFTKEEKTKEEKTKEEKNDDFMYYKLHQSNGHDLVETAINFINDLPPENQNTETK